MKNRGITGFVVALLFVLANLAIAAGPTRAGWKTVVCSGPGGDPEECCSWCILCWGCDTQQTLAEQTLGNETLEGAVE